jgi:RNA polymerase sigma factor (sigma-70 family)
MAVAVSAENPIMACVARTTAIGGAAVGKGRTISRAIFNVFAKHGQGMFRRARRILQSEADADDAVQEVMLSLVRTPRLLGAVRELRAWLLGLVHKRCVDLIRGERRRRERETGTSIEGLFLGTDPAELAERDEICKAIAEAVDALPEDLRWIVVRNELEEMTFREMSEESGIPMGTLMARKAKAIELLRRDLKGRGLTGMPTP